jgi:carbonic anhydrase/acetyltransferase-like protein (isoleucine patch superfamily)
MSALAIPKEVLEHLAATPSIASDAFVAGNAVIVGDVAVGTGSSIWYGCILRGDVQRIRVGARTNLQDGTIVHGTTHGHPALIGDDVTVGHAAVLHACMIEDRAFIGIGARVLDGAVVRSDAMLAAGAVLTPGKALPTGELWAGNPAKLLRKLTLDEIEGIRISAARYVALAHDYRTAPPSSFMRTR